MGFILHFFSFSFHVKFVYKCLNLVSNECQTSFLRGQLVNVCVGLYEEIRLAENSLIVDTVILAIIPILPNYLSALSIVSHRFFTLRVFFSSCSQCGNLCVFIYANIDAYVDKVLWPWKCSNSMSMLNGQRTVLIIFKNKFYLESNSS